MSTNGGEEDPRLSQLTEETKDWFTNLKLKDKNSFAWKPGNMSDGMNDFFGEAREQFSHNSNEVFSGFVKKNQSRFSELMESRKVDDIFEKNRSNFVRRNQMMNLTSNSPFDSFNKESLFQNQSSRLSNFSPSRELFTFPQYSSHLFGTSRMFGVNMNGFDQFPKPLVRNIGLSPEDAPPDDVNNVNGHKTYEMSSSKSMFEYSSTSQRYRFNTEQITQTFDYTSESEEDEEDEYLLDKEILPSPAYDTRSECSDISSVRDLNSITTPAIQYPDPSLRLEKVQKIANELLTTERTYVAALRLVDQLFHFKVDNENRAHKMFPQEVVTQMFSNIKSIFKLHSEHLLPQLEDRMKNWSNDPRIGDVMTNFAPFLKMYTEYVKNFNDAINLINCWYGKLPRFAAIMDDIHKMEECGHLTLQHHMLNPIQRVPRYKLLLTDYLKKLPEDSVDKDDTEKALELVSTAASHANDAMKRIDKFKKLLEIQEMIGGGVDLVSPTRELIKEGKIVKISARSGDHQERYIFLVSPDFLCYFSVSSSDLQCENKFSDMVLLCSQRLMSGRVVSGPCYRVRAKLGIDGLVVADGDNIETANSFYIRNSHKSIELYTHTPEDKADWIEALCKVMCDFVKRKSSLQVTDQALIVSEMELGKRSPIFLKQESISHCMACHTHFSAFAFKKKKHCKACGIVVCSKCSGQKVLLAYDMIKPNRVCDQCYAIVTKQICIGDSLDPFTSQSTSPQSPEDSVSPALSPTLSRGVLEVKSNDPSVISGYLHLKTRGKSWVKRWFALHPDFVLYSFKTHDDDHAVTSTPIPGYVVTLPEKSDNIDGRQHVFKIYHSKNRVYFFQASSQQELQEWVDTLVKASKAECFTPQS
ncbi:FYVE, RhoGEF and PH domain-containing protein 4 [Nymphon striatum]|nr:FYVE, RhoGEF and PH domain-containing protein 4 [Nymphon striatum]